MVSVNERSLAPHSPLGSGNRCGVVFGRSSPTNPYVEMNKTPLPPLPLPLASEVPYSPTAKRSDPLVSRRRVVLAVASVLVLSLAYLMMTGTNDTTESPNQHTDDELPPMPSKWTLWRQRFFGPRIHEWQESPPVVYRYNEFYAHYDPHPEADWPRVAWLMSYPNSGTSYTMKLTRVASNITSGTNYGEEAMFEDESTRLPQSIRAEFGHKGPYYLDPQRFATPPPNRQMYILTKTHCGGRCTKCPPNDYIETQRSFLQRCLTGSRWVSKSEKTDDESATDYSWAEEGEEEGSEEGEEDDDENEEDEKNDASENEGRRLMGTKKATNEKNKDFRKGMFIYNDKIPQKAVHLIRDPFDNVVSRYHLMARDHPSLFGEDHGDFFRKATQARRDGDVEGEVEGFRKWCQILDETYETEERQSRFFDDALRAALEGVPCHSEFYRYVEWHNLAVATAKKLELPTLYVHYEDYNDPDRFDSALDKLLKFLSQPKAVDVPPPFTTGKTYHHYFTDAERDQTLALLQLLSSPETWQLLQRYM